MRPLFAPVLALLFLVNSINVFALRQNPPNPGGQTGPPAPTAQDDDVVRITTNLIQLDVSVTDNNGHPVPDLQPDDFEIQENGHTQQISNFSYVTVAAETRTESPKGVDRNAPPIPPVPLRPEQVRRTFALVVDDLGLSFESIHFVRQALRKFVDQTMQPGDLVAILRTSGGVGSLQQFSSDKRQLIAAIDRIRWYPAGNGRIGAFAPLQGPESVRKPADGAEEDADLENLRSETFTVGTLGALYYIVRGLRELPGRKSVVLLSDGLALFSPGGTTNTRATEELRRLTDLCNRASVVIYTIDARGLVAYDPTAADNTAGMNAQMISQARASRAGELFDTQSGLIYLAKQTGGYAIYNTNGLADGLKRVVNDQSGYYLIGYHPDESTFDPRRLRYNTFEVKLKRKGLNLRYRSGFYGVADDRPREKPALTRDQALVAALMSPFNRNETQLQLTSIFGNDAAAGSYVRSFLHIRAQDLTFTVEPDGDRKAVFDLMAVTFGDRGAPLDQTNRTYTVQMDDRAYRNALRAGLVYLMTVPIKKPGAYQLRIAVRDAASERIGSASQFIEVPDLDKDRLVLSGIAAFGQDPSVLRATANTTPTAGPGATAEEDPEAGVALRRLHSTMVLQYGCYIYNSRLNKTSRKPELTSQVRLFRDGQEIFHGDQLPYRADLAGDVRRLPLIGAIQLGTAMPPGEYVLQVVVTDASVKDKPRIATQWIDFEIVP
jgi:VWFA-related protein